MTGMAVGMAVGTVRRTVTLALLAGVLCIPVSAGAYCYITPTAGSFDPTQSACTMDPNAGMTWQWSCASISVSPDGLPDGITADALRAAVRAAAARWNAVRCSGSAPSFSYVPYPDVDAPFGFDPAGRNANVIGFRAPWPTDQWHLPGSQGITLLTFNPASAHIIDQDLDLNPHGPLPYSPTGAQGAIDLQTLATRALGTMMGIGYSTDTASVMWRELPATTVRRDLSPDDITALCGLYPPGRSAVCEADPYGGFAGDTGCGCVAAGSTRTPRGKGTVGAMGAVGAVGLLCLRRRHSRNGQA